MNSHLNMFDLRNCAAARRAFALLSACLALVALPAIAQSPPATARGSLILDQNNDAFTLQLRQWQQEHAINRATGSDPTVQREMQMQHLQQRQRQDELHGRQLQDFDASAARATPSSGVGGPQPMPPSTSQYERERAEQALRQDYELNELERSAKDAARSKEEVPHWGPTLTAPRE
jgi:hypothetical protein